MTTKRTHISDTPIEYYEKRHDRYGQGVNPQDAGRGVDVIGWYRVKSGVLAGRMCKAYLDTFESEAEAEAVYGPMNWNSPYLEPSQNLDDLPGPEDPVPGGMYPDDIEEGI